MIYGATGHRPPRLNLSYSAEDSELLETFAAKILSNLRVTHIISGGALGWDQAVATAALSMGIPYSMFLPFKNFGKKWPVASQLYLDYLCEHAAKVLNCGEGGGDYNKLYFQRDEMIVDAADLLLALFDGECQGGTYHTVNYALKKNKNIINVWDEFMEFRGEQTR